MIVGIFSNRDKDRDFTVAKDLYNWLLTKDNVTLYLERSIAESIDSSLQGFEPEYMYKNADFIIVLGGDGTLLRVARSAAEFEAPLLGVNLGHLGFLTEIEIENLYDELDKILSGGFHVEKRTMLEAKIIRENEVVGSFLAFNDVGFMREAGARIMRFNLYINDSFVDTYSADGVLIASPTGSTGYALSAGGAILCPTVKALIITPICAHNLYSRSIVISDEDFVKVTCSEDGAEAIVTADGQFAYSLLPKDTLAVHRAKVMVKLVKVSTRSFFDVLRNKITER